MDYMKEVLRLARRGLGATSPNPMVGAVVVKEDKIIGRGYHKCKGEPHAEVIALKQAGPKAKGATLYVNFEPCCHFGVTPPCTKAIIDTGIKEVHISIIDPSPWVNGKGIKELKKAGIKVILGDCEQEAQKLNEVYLKYIKTGLPFISLKAALTLDGKIATLNGESKWITSLESRRFVHRLRSQVDAVMVGIGTVLADDPELTVRLVRGRNPKRIILDSNLRIKHKAKVLGPGCIIATLKSQKIDGTETWQIKPACHSEAAGRKDSNGRVDILEVLKRASKSGIQSILIEGGKEVFTEGLANKLVDKIYFFIAPKILGDGVPVVGDLGIRKLKDALSLSSVKFKRLENDILIESYLYSNRIGILASKVN
ncbi:bifunctional diaminohydroxyphosphoribosylaminopyrimidine deaminase/5-amino-6-(5-phosphoribosylamino)uracil reductase RibD [candidate division WOR-3 bacterium]|nr:bifunctional diaminohydroxyphosphoribosylaminopyrimidine deaminase/5-amino-6-(5-phosphoribosylamino)uracil reductase RibD [candidate division WOR-3 bacterium]